MKAPRGISRETGEQIQKAELFTVASSLSYTTILSLIPLLALSLAIFQAFGGMEKFYDQIRPVIIDNLAEGASDALVARIDHFVSNAHANALGIGGLIGLVVTGMSMLASVEKAINRVWAVRSGRSIPRQLLRYFLFVTLGPLALSVVIAVGSLGTIPWHSLLPSGLSTFFLLVALFFALYKWVPNTQVHPRCAFVAAIAAALAWALARLLYLTYLARVVSYSKVYGSLGAVPILLLWIYIGWFVVLSGATLAATLQNRLEATLR